MALTVAGPVKAGRPATFWPPLPPRHSAEGPEHHFRIMRCFRPATSQGFAGITGTYSEEVPMATRRHGQIIETPTEARQAEPGPSVLALLTVSTGLAVLILGVVWFVFFRA